MKFIGADLHKKTISLCVVMVVDGKRQVIARRRFDCRNTACIRDFFEHQGVFQVVVEATSSGCDPLYAAFLREISLLC